MIAGTYTLDANARVRARACVCVSARARVSASDGACVGGDSGACGGGKSYMVVEQPRLRSSSLGRSKRANLVEGSAAHTCYMRPPGVAQTKHVVL